MTPRRRSPAAREHPHLKRTSSRPLGLIALVAVGALLAGCTATAGAVVAPVPAAPPSITISPASTTPANPVIPLVVAAHHGRLAKVTVTNVHSGVAVTGRTSTDHRQWRSNEPLGYGQQYRITARARRAGGKPVRRTRTVHTLSPAAQAYPTIIPTPSMSSVGIGQPIVVRFSKPVTDRAAAIKALHVTSSPPQPGAWYWMSDTGVHYRPRHYWKPGTNVTVHAKVYGVDLGHGVYGKTDRTVSFHIHDSWIAKANGATHRMTIIHNGQAIKTMPISLGKPSTPTHRGPHVISAKKPSVVMDSCTYGVCKGQSGYYRETVYLDERISNDGEFVHAAPWSEAAQGHRNVSHGCVNLSRADAKWFYQHFGPGDVVDVVHSGGPPLPVWDTYGDWELSWQQWKSGAR
ncbi:MAG: L,D-transpeptidase [Sciscionella sp.]